MEQHALTIQQPSKTKKSDLVFLILGIVFLLGGIGLFIYTFFFFQPPIVANPIFPTIPSVTNTDSDKTYSLLTGEELSDANLLNAPVFCMQTPNGTDGGRPQVGMNEAGVVFEAIAEAGITRFAAIYQNPTSPIIGPIRSLRTYYLEWDTPFDCTIVHAGGAEDALAAVKAGGYSDLTENYTYMYRSNGGNRLWNNLFSTASYLKSFAENTGKTSNISGFARQTPTAAEKSRIAAQATNPLKITEPSTSNTSMLTPSVSQINLNFGGSNTFNVVYNYNATTNSYDRSYATGIAHEIYTCPEGLSAEPIPERDCTLTQLSPKVVIAMEVQERRAADNYHESITTTGSGTAYIFQNGNAIAGTWTKDSKNDQIKFYDENKSEISLIPGQTWISAVPNYGSVAY